MNVKNYLVEKSIDGIHFSDVSTVALGAEILEYNYKDQSSNASSFYYRIASVDDNGLSTCSSIVKVSSTVNNQSSVKLFLTVIQNGSINLQINNNISGQYILNVINNLGQTVLQKEINHPQGVSVDNISLGNSLQKGMMNIVVIAPNKTINTSKIFVR